MTRDTPPDATDAPGRTDAPARGRVGPGLYVRPFGYAADHPVVRRVGDRDVFVGNAAAADPARYDDADPAAVDVAAPAFEYVLSVSLDAYPLTTHHRPMVDSDEVAWDRFAAAVDAARDLLARDGSLLVHCEAGISRSATVLATALAAAEGRRFVEALHLVQAARPHAVPNPTLHECGVLYLAALDRR